MSMWTTDRTGLSNISGKRFATGGIKLRKSSQAVATYMINVLSFETITATPGLHSRNQKVNPPIIPWDEQLVDGMVVGQLQVRGALPTNGPRNYDTVNGEGPWGEKFLDILTDWGYDASIEPRNGNGRWAIHFTEDASAYIRELVEERGLYLP